MDPAEFVELYSYTHQPRPDPEALEASTKRLKELYAQPDTIFILFEIIKDKSCIVRDSAAIGLKAAISNHWTDSFQGNENGEVVKQEILSYISDFLNDSTFQLILEAFVPVFASESAEWRDLYQLISHITESSDILTLNRICELSTTLVNASDFPVVCSNFELYSAILSKAASIPNIDDIEYAVEMLNAVYQKIGEEESVNLTPVFQEFFDKLYKKFHQGSRAYHNIANNIADCLNTPFLDPIASDIFGRLMTLLQTAEIDHIMYYSIFHCFEALIAGHFEQIEELIPDYISLMIQYAASTEDEDDKNYLAFTIEPIVDAEGPGFFDVIQERLSFESPELTLVSIKVLSYSFEYGKVGVLSNLDSIVDTLTNAIIPENGEEIVNAALFGIQELCKIFEPEHSGVASNIIESILTNVEGYEEECTKNAIKALCEAIRCATIEERYIEPIISYINSLVENGGSEEITRDAIYMFSVLIFSAEASIEPFVESILPNLIQGAQYSEDTDAILKGDSLEALSLLVKYAPTQMEDVVGEILPILAESGLTADSILRRLIVDSIGNLVNSGVQVIIEISEQICNLVDFCFSSNMFADQSQGEAILDDAALNCLHDAILLVKAIFKHRPEIGMERISIWYEACSIAGVETGFDHMAHPALSAMAYMVLRSEDGDLVERFGALLKEQLEGDSKAGAGAAFSALKTLLKAGCPPAAAWLEWSAPLALQAMGHALPCMSRGAEEEEAEEEDEHDEENDEAGRDYITDSLYAFASVAALQHSDALPVAALVDATKRVVNTCPPAEKQACAAALGRVFTGCGWLTEIERKFIVKQVISCVAEVDTTVEPSSLSALLAIYEADPRRVNMEEVGEVVAQIIEQEPTGQRFFWATSAAAVAFACSMITKSPSLFDYDRWVPAILGVLPLRTGEEKSELVYSTMARLAGNLEILEANGEEFTRVFASVLAKPQRTLAKLGLSEQTIAAMAAAIKVIISSAGAEPVFSVLSTAQEQERLSALLSGK